MRLHIFFLSMLAVAGLQAGQWAEMHHKKFSEHELRRYAHDNELYYCKESVPMFSQLLCSWNAIRPIKGHFVFFVQARNAHTQKWGVWHKMTEWGKNVQYSHATKSDGFTKYVHVRLETEPLQLADAFRVKVIGAKGAPLTNVKSIAVTTANLRAFKPERITDTLYSLQSVHLARVPKISQMALDHPDNKKICSPVSCAMLTHYLSGKPVSPMAFAKLSHDKGLKIYGSWPFNTAHAFERCKGKEWFYTTRLNSFTDLHQQLTRGIPTIVSIRGALPGAVKSFPHGHLLVIVGWDKTKKEVLCHDPAESKHHMVLKRYKLDHFLTAWERSHRLTYWAEPA